MKNYASICTHYYFALLAILVTSIASPLAFAAQVSFNPVSPSVNRTFGYAVGDLNRDGRADLVAVRIGGSAPTLPNPRSGEFGFTSRYVSISLISTINLPDGSFQETQSLATDLYTRQEGFDDAGFFAKQLVDINGDGVLDVVLRQVFIDNGQLGIDPLIQPRSVVFFGYGNGAFNPAYVSLTLPDNFVDTDFTLPKPNRLFVDMNGDGKADYIAPSQNGLDILIYVGNGNGGFSTSPSSITAVTSPASGPVIDIRSLVVADVNHDGLPDICLIADNPTTAFANEQSLHVMVASANGTYQDTIIDSFHAPAGSYSNLIAQHAKPNSEVALLLSRATFSTQNVDPDFVARAYLGNSQGTFSLVNSLAETPAVFGDFDGDGIIDALTFAGSTDSTSNFRMNKGAGGGVYTDAGTFTVNGGKLSNLATLSGPHRFGSGATPGVLLSNFNYIRNTNSLTPVLSQPVVAPLPKIISFAPGGGPIVNEEFRMRFTAALNAPTTAPSLLRVTLISGTAEIGTDVSPIMDVTDQIGNTMATITSGDTFTLNPGASSVIVRVVVLGDNLIEPIETFRIALDVISGGLQPGQFKAEVAIQDTTIASAITSVTSPTVKEGQKAQFAVTLSAATTQASSVRLSLADVTTTSGLDYATDIKYSDDGGLTYQSVVSGGMANIRAGVTSFLVRVTTLKDAIEEPSETYQLVVNPVSGLASNVGMGTGTVLDKSKKEKSLFDQVRGVADSASKTAESFTTRIINSWMVKSVSGLFSWR